MMAFFGIFLILFAIRMSLRRQPKSQLHLHVHLHILPPPHRDGPPAPPPDILGELDRVVRDHRQLQRTP
jgi:hypothetical protein